MKKSFSILRLHEFKFLWQNCITSDSLSRTYEAFSTTTPTMKDTENNDIRETKSVNNSSGLKTSPFIMKILNQDDPFKKEPTDQATSSQVKQSSSRRSIKSIEKKESGDEEEDDNDYDYFDDYEDEEESEEQETSDPNRKRSIEISSFLRSQIKSSKLNKATPILTNTTLNIMRLFGKYVQMFGIFRMISNELLDYLMQLFYFYFYSVFTHFIQPIDVKKIVLSIYVFIVLF